MLRSYIFLLGVALLVLGLPNELLQAQTGREDFVRVTDQMLQDPAPEDWPMWRHDAGRSAASSETLHSDLALRWTRQLVAPRMAWPEDPRIHFDATLEPVSTGNQIFIASSATDSVIALDANTGVVRWQVFADGPIRFAPVVAHQQVYFGADDGYIYCVSAESGALLWRKAAKPAGRKAIGSERVISVWPIRGGPVLYNDQIHFTAGVWPFEGVLLYSFRSHPTNNRPLVFSPARSTPSHPRDTLWQPAAGSTSPVDVASAPASILKATRCCRSATVARPTTM